MDKELLIAGGAIYCIGAVFHGRVRAPWFFPAPSWLRWLCLRPWSPKLEMKAVSLQLGALLMIASGLLLPQQHPRWLPPLLQVGLFLGASVALHMGYDHLIEYGHPRPPHRTKKRKGWRAPKQ
jgi:hypothetical protein